MEKEIDAESTAFIVLSHFGFETKDTSNYLAMWRAKGDDIRARRRNIQKASEEIINGIKSKMTEEQPKEESDIEENTQHNSAIIKVYRADGVIHANINGEEKKFEVDKFYFQELRDSKNAYKTLMELVRKGYASELTSPKRPAND